MLINKMYTTARITLNMAIQFRRERKQRIDNNYRIVF